MTKTFMISELEDVVKPNELIGVLEVLVDNGFIWAYDMDFTQGTVTLDIPRAVEVQNILRELTEAHDSGKVKKGN